MYQHTHTHTHTCREQWELLVRARALDNQMFVAACSPARDVNASYVAWGHSTIVNPMAQVLARAGEGEEVVHATLDLEAVHRARTQIPVTRQRRFDLYPDVAAAAAAAATSSVEV